MPTAHEQLSEQFHRWEVRTRWKVYDEPVCLEPPFVQFVRHYLPETPVIDDGRRPTFLSSLFRKGVAVPEPVPEIPEPKPTPLIREPLAELQVALPADLDVAKDLSEQFFSNISLCQEPIAFELLGVHKRVVAQFAASKEDAPAVGTQLQAQFPTAQFRELEGSLVKAWDAIEGDYAFVVEFGLEKEFDVAAGHRQT